MTELNVVVGQIITETLEYVLQAALCYVVDLVVTARIIYSRSVEALSQTISLKVLANSGLNLLGESLRNLLLFIVLQ